MHPISGISPKIGMASNETKIAESLALRTRRWRLMQLLLLVHGRRHPTVSIHGHWLQ